MLWFKFIFFILLYDFLYANYMSMSIEEKWLKKKN